MLTTALNTAISGLFTTQTRLGTVTRNLTNASTDGYTRKEQQQTTLATGGVLPAPIRRMIDEALVREIRRNASDLGETQTRLDALTQLDALHGSPDGDSSLSAMIGALAGAFETLSADPAQNSALDRTLAAADDLARTFRTLSDGINTIRTELRNRLSDEVDNANSLLSRIDGVNREILRSHALDGDTTDLEDERDRLVLELSGAMRVSGFVDERGGLHLYSAAGEVDLLAPTPATIVADGDGNLSVNGQTVSAGGGKLAAFRDQLSDTIPQRLRQLDDIARAVTETLDTAPLDLFNDGGATAFDPVGNPGQDVGYAGRIAVNDALRADPTLLRGPAGTDTGDTTIIRAAHAQLVRTDLAFTAPGLPATGSLTQAASEMIVAQVNGIDDANRRASTLGALREHLDSRFAEDSGVNVDTEMALMLVLQNSYAATARTVQAIQGMFDDLLNMV